MAKQKPTSYPVPDDDVPIDRHPIEQDPVPDFPASLPTEPEPRKVETEAEPRKSPRGLDPELQTMAKIDRLMADLSDDAQHRVLEWLSDRNRQKRFAVERAEWAEIEAPV